MASNRSRSSQSGPAASSTRHLMVRRQVSFLLVPQSGKQEGEITARPDPEQKANPGCSHRCTGTPEPDQRAGTNPGGPARTPGPRSKPAIASRIPRNSPESTEVRCSNTAPQSGVARDQKERFSSRSGAGLDRPRRTRPRFHSGMTLPRSGIRFGPEAKSQCTFLPQDPAPTPPESPQKPAPDPHSETCRDCRVCTPGPPADLSWKPPRRAPEFCLDHAENASRPCVQSGVTLRLFLPPTRQLSCGTLSGVFGASLIQLLGGSRGGNSASS